MATIPIISSDVKQTRQALGYIKAMGVKALMVAVLENGINSYLSPVQQTRAEADRWVRSARQRGPFCFTVVCETLGLDPDAVRATLRRRRAQDTSVGRPIGRNRPNVHPGQQIGSPARRPRVI